jgi:pimeloyl-ACP methyl ester carboxylesterase
LKREIEGAAMVDENPGRREDSSSTRGRDAPLRVVLVHGAPDRSRSFTATVRELTGYAVSTYDRRGYGQRAGHPPEPTGDIFEHAEDLITMLDGTPTPVVGHSFGGIVAMAASVKAPELISALGLWEPPLVWTSWWPDTRMQEATAVLAESRDVFKLGELYTRAAMGEAAWQALPAAQRSGYRAEGAALLADMRSILREPFALSSVTAPVVVGCGSGGKDGYDAVARQLASYLSAQLFDVAGAPHLVHVSQPKTFAHLVRRTVSLSSLNTDRSL